MGALPGTILRYAEPPDMAEAVQPIAAEELEGLMRRYVAGERAGFDGLYRVVAPRLLGYLTGLLGERAAAEDAMQLTFIRLHEARGSYVLGADPAPWIFTIGHRVALDELRRKKRARVRLAGADERVPEPAADLDGSERGSARPVDDRLQVTLAAIAQLPESQRAALLLTKVEGRSVAEAAAISGTTSGAVKLRAHRAYVTLRKLLGQERA